MGAKKELDHKKMHKLMSEYTGVTEVIQKDDVNVDYDYFLDYNDGTILVFKVTKLYNSEIVMHDDIVITSRGLRRVSIQGGQGTYRTIDGVSVNVAVGNEGYMYDALDPCDHSDDHYRAMWSRLSIVKRACPDMFNHGGC